jgi:hypothetical protein
VPLEELAEEVEDEDDEEPRRTRTSHGELSECLTMKGWMELAMFDFDCMGGMSCKCHLDVDARRRIAEIGNGETSAFEESAIVVRF